MNKDRKLMKWQGAFFLPEHLKLLKQAENDYYKKPRPILDDSQIEEMEQLLTESLTNKKMIEIETWKDGFFNSRVGFVKKIDPYSKKISILDELNSSITIDFYQITNVSIK